VVVFYLYLDGFILSYITPNIVPYITRIISKLISCLNKLVKKIFEIIVILDNNKETKIKIKKRPVQINTIITTLFEIGDISGCLLYLYSKIIPYKTPRITPYVIVEKDIEKTI